MLRFICILDYPEHPICHWKQQQRGKPKITQAGPIARWLLRDPLAILVYDPILLVKRPMAASAPVGSLRIL